MHDALNAVSEKIKLCKQSLRLTTRARQRVPSATHKRMSLLIGFIGCTRYAIEGYSPHQIYAWKDWSSDHGGDLSRFLTDWIFERKEQEASVRRLAFDDRTCS
jgi:hypothetical protein